MDERGILVVGMGGKVFGLDRTTGAIVWRNDMSGGGFGEVFLAIGSGLVVASAHGSVVFGLDYATGEVRWEQETQSSGRATILIDETQIVVTKAGYLDCFDLEGRALWSQPMTGLGTGRASLGFPGNVAQADGIGRE